MVVLVLLLLPPFLLLIAPQKPDKKLLGESAQMGPGAVLSNPPGAICSGLGTSGHALHAGGARITATSRYDYINGRAMCANINVVYQMRKVTEADGGFCVVRH